MGHARAILGSQSPEQQLEIYKKIISNGLSVRKVEELVNNSKPESAKPVVVADKYDRQQQYLEQKLGRKVKITSKQLTISFKNEEDLNRLIELLF